MTEPQPEVPVLDDLDIENLDPYEGMEFAPYDPMTVATPPLAGTPQGGGKDTENEVGPFDPRYKDDFSGLMFLGALEARFDFLGHRFVIRSLTTHELLGVGMIVKEYEGTVGDSRAYATAIVAMSVVSVDGMTLPMPIKDGETGYDWAFQRFAHATRWYPYVIDYVYERFLLLEERVRTVLMEMTEQAKKEGRRAESTPG